MPLDPSIILGAKNPQFDLSQFSPVNTLASAMKLKQLDQEGQLNALTLKERKELRDYLSGGESKQAPDFKSSDTRTQLATRFGESGRKVASSLTDIGAADTNETKRRNDLTVSKTAQYKNLLTNVDDRSSALKWIQLQQNDPDMAGSPITKIGIMDAARKIPADPEGFNRWKQQAALGIDEYIKQNKPSFQQINRSGQTDLLQTPGLGGAPTTIGSYADVPLPDAVQAQNMAKAVAGRNMSLVNMPPQEKAEQADRGKLLVKQYDTISEIARVGARTLPALETNLSALNKGFSTGFGTEAKAAAAKVLGALGVQDAKDYATNAETFLAQANAAVLQKQLEQKGPQTESDAQRITTTGARQSNTVDANKFLLSVAKAQIKQDIDQRNFYDKWWKTNKTYDGAEDAWYAGEGGKSLFTRPELKTYAGATQDNAAQIPTAATPTRAAPAVTAFPQGAVDALKAGRGTDAQFDAIFGPGAAKRARGGK